jgi:hypothetical protein
MDRSGVGSTPFGITDVIAIPLITIGPLKTLIVHTTVTQGAERPRGLRHLGKQLLSTLLAQRQGQEFRLLLQ